MKNTFIEDILKMDSETEIFLLGWIASKRKYKKVIFIDVIDSTGKIQAIIEKHENNDLFHKVASCKIGDAIRIKGKLMCDKTQKQIVLEEIHVISRNNVHLSPNPYKLSDIFSEKYVNYFMNNRHFYMKHPKFMAVLRARHKMIDSLRDFFKKQGLTEITAPILTQIPLYPENTAFCIDFWGTKVFLTQCVAFYLESAVLSFEKVFNIGPSFRREKSKGRRHLAEYWHVKVELAWANIDDIIRFAEDMIYYLAKQLRQNARSELEVLNVFIDLDKLRPPYPQISYDEALEILERKGKPLEWGRSFGADEEKLLSEEFQTPFWIRGIPKVIEPFPYELDENNPNITKVADLIAPEGFGELLGVAEKIWKYDKLIRKMQEKGIDPKTKKYEWYLNLREFGCVPHSGIGIGVERVLRWLLKLSHVRDTIPFPRTFQRKPYP